METREKQMQGQIDSKNSDMDKDSYDKCVTEIQRLETAMKAMEELIREIEKEIELSQRQQKTGNFKNIVVKRFLRKNKSFLKR